MYNGLAPISKFFGKGFQAILRPSHQNEGISFPRKNPGKITADAAGSAGYQRKAFVGLGHVVRPLGKML
jgi:hypothetical protein